jgi:PBSX family phage portal protein
MKSFGVITQSGQFVGKSVLAQYATKQESRAITEDRFSGTYGDGSDKLGLIEPPYKPEALAGLLEQNTYHYRACRTKARDTAGLGWKLVPVDEDAPLNERDAINDTLGMQTLPLTMMLDHAQVDFEAVGWAAIEVVRTDYRHDGELVALNHIPAHTIRVHQDEDRYAQRRGKRTRWFRAAGTEQDVDYEDGSVHDPGTLPIDRRASELLFWRNYTPRSDFYGVPDVIPAIGAIHGDLARRDFNIAFFQNYGVPAYVVFITGDYDDEEVLDGQGNPTGETVLQQSIEEHFSELNKRPHSTLVMSVPSRSGGDGEVKVTFERLSVDVKEASFRLYRADNRDEILSAHGVDPYRAGIAEAGSLGGNTAHEQAKIYKQSVIEPRQQMIESLINRYVIRSMSEHWRWELEAIDTVDERHELDMLRDLFSDNVITASEYRKHYIDRFGLDPEFDVTGQDSRFAVASIPELIIDGVITMNEGRSLLGLDPIPGGDELRAMSTAEVDEIEAAVLSLQDKLVRHVTKEGIHVNGVGAAH